MKDMPCADLCEAPRLGKLITLESPHYLTSDGKASSELY